MSLTRKLSKLLGSHNGILKQLQWNLILLGIYMPTKRQFERQHNGNQTTSDDGAQEAFKFPDYPRAALIYRTTSNIHLVWVALKYLVPSLLEMIHRYFYKLLYAVWDSREILDDGRCFSFGRFVIHYEQSQELFGVFLAGCHLLWRLLQQIMDRPFSLDVAVFLLQRREDIASFIKKLEAANGSIERGVRRQRRLSLPYKSDGTHLGLNYDHLTRHERLLCDIMCYEVTFMEQLDGHQDKTKSVVFRRPPKILYKLRPNRTLEARQVLIDKLTTTTLRVSAILSSLISLFTVYIFTVVVFNQKRYYKDFIGCDPEFSRQFEAGQIKQWSLPQLTGHRVCVIVGDTIENLIVWGESGLVGLFALTFGGFLNQDLLLYWRKLEQKIHKHCSDTSQIHQYLHGIGQTRSTDRILHTLHEETYELQAQLGDFFHQIQRVDLLLSDIITDALLIWLLGFGIISFRAAKLWSSTGNIDDISIFVVVCLVAFVGYSIVSFDILSLQRRCQRSYLAICSMMAHDQTKYKKHFVPLIDFYTEKNRTCYTWFQQVPFSSGNFLSIVGWSLTGFVIIDAVFNRSK